MKCLKKIATGTVNKFLKEITLVNQTFVKDEKLTIEQLLIRYTRDKLGISFLQHFRLFQ